MNSNLIASTWISRVPCRLVVLGAAILATLLVLLFRDTIQSWVVAWGTLANDAPAAELLEEYLRHAPDPDAAILACWNTGKIVHREFAMRQLADGNRSISPELESVLLAGALDPDLSVREFALNGLRAREHPALISLAAAQLRDPDPQVRLLGLDYPNSAGKR
jgi:hypothetical protein